MCGIVGFIDFSPGRQKEKMERLGLEMLNTISRRGPTTADYGWMPKKEWFWGIGGYPFLTFPAPAISLCIPLAAAM